MSSGQKSSKGQRVKQWDDKWVQLWTQLKNDPGVKALARETGISAAQLERELTYTGTLTFDTAVAIFEAIGQRLHIAPIEVSVLPLKTRAAYLEALEDAGKRVQQDPPAWSLSGKELRAISDAIEVYETEHYPNPGTTQQRA
jgi:hypothetical protein